uniref:Uncharacterized protein n=1 Tax=Anguilla anguilla TaxID=7936 RepID=A0A0E9URM2_ANGAN
MQGHRGQRTDTCLCAIVGFAEPKY